MAAIAITTAFGCGPTTVVAGDRDRTQAALLFQGGWETPAGDRHLTIAFDEPGYATINDWADTVGDEPDIEAYKAFVEGRKLVLPAQTGDHLAPRCELLVQGKRMLLKCEDALSASHAFVSRTYFVRPKHVPDFQGSR